MRGVVVRQFSDDPELHRVEECASHAARGNDAPFGGK